MTKLTLAELKGSLSRPKVLMAWLVMIAVLAWSYSAAMATIVAAWWKSPDYGHGFLVPVFAAVLLWTRREMIHPMSLEECWEKWGWGLAGGLLGTISGFLMASQIPEASFAWYHPWLAALYGGTLGAALLQLAPLFLEGETGEPFSAPGSMWGLAFLGFAAFCRAVSEYFFFQLLAPFALVPWVAGLTLFIGGWRAMRWAWPAIVFLLFMVPLPGFLSGMSAQTLQKIGTKTTVFTIQTLGLSAVAQGNVIQLENRQLNVVEACSGLRMLMLFIAVCVGTAFVLKCPLWERIVIALSAAPIAIFANVVRLTITALLYHLDWGELADHLIHKGAGLFMMPLAFLVLWGELSLLKLLFLEPASERPLTLGRTLAADFRNRQS
ncbi:MAG: exosortase/archaeosortase family protein [Pirellulales bacterium]|nr:exosortase/archaeosortase family protein [Pirellulales bacterium]